jgi:hypothetical protein
MKTFKAQKLSLKKILVVVLAGSLLGYTGSRVLFVGSGLSLIPWSLAGAVIGIVYANSARDAVAYGGTYGFALAFVFMLSGYNGSDPVVTKLGFFALLGIFGAVCGLVLALVGLGIRLVSRKRFGHHPEA